MRPLGWILTGLVALAVASTRRSGPAPGQPCTPDQADRANRLLLRADAELALQPGQPVQDPVDLVELEAVAREIEMCLPFMAERPNVSPADELRARAALLKLRRAATPIVTPPAGGSPAADQPATPAGSTSSPADALAAEVDKQIAASQIADPRAPETQQLMQRMMATIAQLERAGLTTEAARLRRSGQILLAKVAGGVPPEPEAPAERPAPGVLPQDLSAQVDAVMAAPNAEPVAAEALADRISAMFRAGSFSNVIQALHKRAQDLRATRPPPTPADAIRLLRETEARPDLASPSTLEAIAIGVQEQDGRVAAALKDKAAQIRAQRGIPT